MALCFLFNFSKQCFVLRLINRSNKSFYCVQAFLDLIEMMLVVILDTRIGDVLDALHSLCDFVELMLDSVGVIDWPLKLLQVFAAVVHLIHWTHQIFHTLKAEVNLCVVMLSVYGIVRPLQIFKRFNPFLNLIEVVGAGHIVQRSHKRFHCVNSLLNLCIMMLTINFHDRVGDSLDLLSMLSDGLVAMLRGYAMCVYRT